MVENGIQGLQPVERETLKSKVSRVLRQAIQNGQLRPGQRLVEEEISQQLGVSRVPVREAILNLEKDGLVVRERGKGARVANPDESDVREIFELRLALEGYALKVAVEKMEEKDLQTIQNFVDQMKGWVEKEDLSQLQEMEFAFHEAICKATGNQKLLDVWRSQISQLRIMFTLSGSQGLDTWDWVKGHEQILHALRDHDVESAQYLLERHIALSRDRLLNHMRERGD